MIQDSRDAFRLLIRTPSVTIAVTATLALGVGATSAMFAVADRLVLNPVPFAGGERIVFLWRANRADAVQGITTVTGREVAAWRESLRSFEAIESFSVSRAVLTDRGEPRSMLGRSISTGLLAMLGVTPQLGRAFDDRDAQPDATATAMLSHTFWREAFGADPDIIGHAITLDGEAYVVTGVTPRGFTLPLGGEHDFWRPQLANGPPGAWKRPQLFVIGRLARRLGGRRDGSAAADARTVRAPGTPRSQPSRQGNSRVLYGRTRRTGVLLDNGHTAARRPFLHGCRSRRLRSGRDRESIDGAPLLGGRRRCQPRSSPQRHSPDRCRRCRGCPRKRYRGPGRAAADLHALRTSPLVVPDVRGPCATGVGGLTGQGCGPCSNERIPHSSSAR